MGGLMCVYGNTCPSEWLKPTTTPAFLWQWWWVNGRRAYLQGGKRKRAWQTDCVEGHHAQSILKRHSIIPTSNSIHVLYVANSLKSSILNLYDWWSHKHCKKNKKYSPLGMLSGSLDTTFTKRDPNPWKEVWYKWGHHSYITSVSWNFFSNSFC